MEEKHLSSEERLAAAWNDTFPDYRLTPQNLANPSFVMGAVLEIYNKLDINKDVIIAPPPAEEYDNHTEYYYDLLPIMNAVRVFYQLLPINNNSFKVSLATFLAPNRGATEILLLLLYNMWGFNMDRTNAIDPREQELFLHRDQVQVLECKKNKLLDLLNDQATDKASRSVRLEKIDEQTIQVSKELKQEEYKREDLKHEIEVLISKNNHLVTELEQKETHKESILSQTAQVKAQKVTDAEDVLSQHNQVLRKEKEANETLENLKQELLNKRNAVKNLEDAKTKIDEALNLTYDIAKVTEELRSLSNEQARHDAIVVSEVQSATIELQELEAQLVEIQVERQALTNDRAKLEEDTTQQKQLAYNVEEKRNKLTDQVQTLSEELKMVKELTHKHSNEHAHLQDTINNIKNAYYTKLKIFEDAILEQGWKSVKIMEANAEK